MPSAANSDGTGSSKGRESATIGAACTPLLRKLFSRSARATGDGRGAPAAGAALGGATALLPAGGAGGGGGAASLGRGRRGGCPIGIARPALAKNLAQGPDRPGQQFRGIAPARAEI